MATAAEALAWERSQLGHVGGGKYWQDMGYNYTDANAPAWCLCFQCDCFKSIGLEVPGLPQYGCSSYYWWLQRNRPDMLVSDPKPGDLVLYDWGIDDYPCDHVGMVVSATSSTVVSYEGNTTGNAVAVKTRDRSNVRAFVRPPYDEEEEMTAAEWQKLQKMMDKQKADILASVGVKVWGYRNDTYERYDAYRILRDVRDAIFPGAAKKADPYAAKDGLLAKIAAKLGIK